MRRRASPQAVIEVRDRFPDLLAEVPDEAVAGLIEAHLADLRRRLGGRARERRRTVPGPREGGIRVGPPKVHGDAVTAGRQRAAEPEMPRSTVIR